MHVNVLMGFLLFFVVFVSSAEEKKCRMCPLSKRFSPKIENEIESTYDETCECRIPLFYDEINKTCVNLKDCPIVKELNNIQENPLTIFSQVFDTEDFMSLLNGDAFILCKVALVDTGILTEEDMRELVDSKEGRIIKAALQQHIGSVFLNYSTITNIIFNPFVRKNPTILKKCGSDDMCITEYFIKRHQKLMKLISEDFMVNLSMGFNNLGVHLKECFEVECEEDECKFVKFILILLDSIEE
ncbi:uncharacterized protein LOC126881839 [Diabrotica virgifera virgifera]|uniref:Uncharacterized protein n=1 Tax=Diabrotica virgifera virgifera TaxID=50390 RepID=A0ABM5JWU1_DIAVI|nr:uncharacterized protein LOC126881839 [Diabrotica virgifera virgifera]